MLLYYKLSLRLDKIASYIPNFPIYYSVLGLYCIIFYLNLTRVYIFVNGMRSDIAFIKPILID